MGIKRVVDMVLAAALLLLVVPLVAVVVALQRMRGRGAAIERVWRLGRGGRRFRMWRLRFDPAGQAASGLGVVVLANLPQLLNVLAGHMSLVGPRPLAPEALRAGGPVWRQVLAVRPGMLSLAQVMLMVERGGATGAAPAPDPTAPLRILPVQLHLDLYYVERWSPLLDLQLIGLAVLLLAQPGRYAAVI
ncbi:sugar transferase [Kouleothrix sp.]|uniref:sugar transferase n=1 Tax=Kouleothrix sp. TaxID=2779161 RepID=UPI00391885F8